MLNTRTTFAVAVLGLLAMGFGKPVEAGMNKFEKEVEKERGAVKLVREVIGGGYDVVGPGL